MEEESRCVDHVPCPRCGSKDNLALYDDGHTWCFTPGCGYRDSKHNNERVEQVDFVDGVCEELRKRKIRHETVEKWGYTTGTFKGKKVQVANYKSAGRVIAQKLRFPNKDFLFIGDLKNAGLYGQHLWRDGGKMVTVVEGEVDALSLSQALGNKWPVVSIPNGAAGARKALARELEWLEKFDTVVLMFDQDDAGVKAVEDSVPLFSPGKVKVASLPMKDPSEMLMEGREREMVDAIWGAKVHRPDGIIDGKDLWNLISKQEQIEASPYPFASLNSMTQGIRRGEIVTLTAGSGVGKSQVCREIANHLLLMGHKVGYLALEENNRRTALGFVGLYLNKPIHLQNIEVDPEDLKKAFDETLGTGNLFLYDHWGSMEPEHLFSKLRYMVKGLGCEYLILDHISIVISGMDRGDERRLLDFIMTKLRSLVEEVQCGLLLVSHLRRPSGDKGHEDGARTSLSQLRGSHGIAQLSDIVVGCERDQQGENPNLTTVRVLKNRWTGETGKACKLEYSKETGRMTEVDFDRDSSDEDPYGFNKNDGTSDF
jgi:twinkle protein|tara:strand:- start:747 stop:2369 length:1623 start_codon:yes stop_codon:yes gene_type:complete